MSKLNEKRDKLARDYSDEYFFETSHLHEETFKRGFDAALAEVMPMMREMAKALEEYQGQFERCGRPAVLLGCWIVANEALDKYTELVGK